MAKKPTPTQSDFPIAKEAVDKHIADAASLADRNFEQFGWNKPKASKSRKPRAKK